jgi:hypothetical protein
MMDKPIYRPTTRADAEARPTDFFSLLRKIVDGGHLLQMSSIELRVLLIHLRHRNAATGLSWPSLQTQTRLAASNKRDVIRALKRLQAKGIMRKVKRGGGRANSSVWMIVAPDMETVAGKAPFSAGDKGLRSQLIIGGDSRIKGGRSQQGNGGGQSPPKSIKNRKRTTKPKTMAMDGVFDFDDKEAVVDTEKDEAAQYLIDLGVNPQTVLAAGKKHGPTFLADMVMLADEKQSDITIRNLPALVASALRRGPAGANGHRNRIHVERDDEGYRNPFASERIRERVCGEDGYL